jgi:hypothetical protein
MRRSYDNIILDFGSHDLMIHKYLMIILKTYYIMIMCHMAQYYIII